MRAPHRLLSSALGAVGLTATAIAQAPQQATGALAVFLDCQAPYCDFDHARREITFVNWMRNREDAHVHVLVTAQPTGGGGWEFTLTFLGRGPFAGQTDTLHHVSSNTDSAAEIRDALTRTLGLGLVRYAARTPLAPRLRVAYQPDARAPTEQVRPEDDPWNFWTFRIGLGGSLSGEQRQRFFSYNASVAASRVTETYKLTINLSGSQDRSEFDIPDLDTTIVSVRSERSARLVSVWSMGPRWSLGWRSSFQHSTFLNLDLALRAGPAIEFDLYPYSESTRRLVVAQYAAGIALFDYDQETIFDRTAETRPEHQLVIGTEIQQPWGSVDLSLVGSQFLHDVRKHSLSLSGGVTWRLVRGLDLRLFGSIARIKDQLYLSKVGLTPEEILLRQQQLGTDFRYFVFLNLQYRFGSRFANVVNPRMRFGGAEQQVFFFF